MKIKKGDGSSSSPARTAASRARSSRSTRAEPRHRRGRQPRQEAHQGRPDRARRQDRRHRDVEAPIHVSNVMVVDAGRQGRPASATAATTRRQERARARAGPGRTSDDRQHRRPRRTAPRLKKRYRAEIVAGAEEQFGFANVMQVPGLVKIVVNMGVGEAARDAKLIDGAVRDLTADHRPEAAGPEGPQVDRPVQAARGHADRRASHAARRPHVGVPRPAAVARAAAHP